MSTQQDGDGTGGTSDLECGGLGHPEQYRAGIRSDETATDCRHEHGDVTGQDARTRSLLRNHHHVDLITDLQQRRR